MLRGYGGPEEKAKSLAAGLDLRGTKPVDVDELQRLVTGPPAKRP